MNGSRGEYNNFPAEVVMSAERKHDQHFTLELIGVKLHMLRSRAEREKLKENYMVAKLLEANEISSHNLKKQTNSLD